MMKRYLLCLIVLFLLLSGLMVTPPSITHAAPSSCIDPNGTNVLEGTLGGANYTIAVPSNWKGTLILYSHGYVFPNQPLLNPAVDVSNPMVKALLQQGYAEAGSSYSQNGWAVQQAFHDQIALLDFFNATCGHPSRTIAAGNSLGGIITAGLVQLYPDRFAGALPLCGPLAGSVGNWNQGLDGAFAFNALLAGSSLSLVHLTDPTGTFNQAEGILAAAQQTAAGRARIALMAALADLPGWFDPASPEPASQDVTTQEQNQFLWIRQIDLAFVFLGRAELEARAAGNPSWNTGVNYSQQLERSADYNEVQALYQQARLSLQSDLSTLAAAPRIQADPGALQYLSSYIIFNGDVKIPVLTMHTTGDGWVVNQNEQAYASVVRAAKDSSLLRELFVQRAGHCTFTPAETLTAFQTLIHRLDTGKWDDSTNPDLLNQEAAALGPTLNIVPPAFLNFEPTPFLRPFDVRN